MHVPQPPAVASGRLGVARTAGGDDDPRRTHQPIAEQVAGPARLDDAAGRQRLAGRDGARDLVHGRVEVGGVVRVPGVADVHGSVGIRLGPLVLAYAVTQRSREYTTGPRMHTYGSLVAGLGAQQIANDPGGDRWTRHLEALLDMFLDHFVPEGSA